MSTCIGINSACWLLYKLLLKIYFMSRTGSEFMYTNVIISSSLKPYQIFGPDLSPDCLLMFSVVLPPVVIHNQRDRQFQNRPRVFYHVARVAVGGHDAWKYTLHMKNCQTPNTWPLSISFPFSGLQEYHFQLWTHNLRVLKTCFQSYTKCIRV